MHRIKIQKKPINKKIKNAKKYIYNNMEFKSGLEVYAYKQFLLAGFDVVYEPTKFIIVDGFSPHRLFYNSGRKNKVLKLQSANVQNTTYTPDFIIKYKNYTIIIETKGFENDVFPLKKKLFRKLLENNIYENYMYMEVKNQNNITEAIKIINDL